MLDFWVGEHPCALMNSIWDISWESPSVMISFTEWRDSSPRRPGRASWNNHRKNQDLSFGAKHLTTTVTFPFESFTESVTKGLLSLFVSCVPSTHKTSGKAWNRRLPSDKTQQQPMSISWSSLAPTARLLSNAYFLKSGVSDTCRGTDFSWKGGISSVGNVTSGAITETLVSSSDTSSALPSICAALELFPRSSFVLPLLKRQTYEAPLF